MGFKGLLYRKFKKKGVKKDPTERAKQIIKEHTISDKEYFDIIFERKDVDKYCFHKALTIGKEVNRFEILPGHWIFTGNQIINALIKNKFDLDKSINYLHEENAKKIREVKAKMRATMLKIPKKTREAKIREEVFRMQIRDQRRKIREEAEKRLYGKVKTRRRTLTEEETEMIFKKFGNKCVVCGVTEGLHIHHKNRDPKDNRIENLTVLCGICHKKVHMKVR